MTHPAAGRSPQGLENDCSSIEATQLGKNKPSMALDLYDLLFFANFGLERLADAVLHSQP
jgi:hypothetical protein